MSGTAMTPLSLTRTLLGINTINPPGRERESAHALAKLLEEAGFRTEFYEFGSERTTLVARLDGTGEKRPILFTGHLDTVPLGSTAWKKDPFAGELDGDRLYGRGSSDMKAGVAAMVMMALRMAKLGDLKGGITLVLTAGEETACQGARYVVSLGNALPPSGAMVVGEPTGNHPLIGHKGCVRFIIKAEGVTAHASTPTLGDNAIHKAAEAIIELRSFDFGLPPHPILGAPTLNIGTIAGGMNINSVPDYAQVGIDIRTIPGQDEQDIRARLQRALGADVKVEYLEGAPGLETDPNDAWVCQVFDVMEVFLKKRPRPAGATYFTDGSVLAPACGNPPVVILGPGEAPMAHKTDEYCSVKKLEEAVEAYTQIALKWCTT